METEYKFENILDIINTANKYKGGRKRSRTSNSYSSNSKSTSINSYESIPYNKDLEKLVDFCDNVTDQPPHKSKVVHETDCVSTKYSHLDVDCHCFRHKSYVVHGKWFWE